MQQYITVMFWLGCLSIFFRSINLIGEHPRMASHSIGEDALALIISLLFLAWVGYLKYWT